MENVAIIVVTFNRLILLKECIEALRKQTFNHFQIIVINNGSNDGTKEWLELQTDIITITQNNAGGAGGFYTGLKYSAEHNYIYSWVMDDDTIPTPNALKELIISSEHLDDFGFICSKVVDIEGNTCNYPIIDEKISSKGEFQWLNEIDRNLIRVTASSFVSVLFKNDSVKKYGLPYSEFFIWGDDSEFTTRLSIKHLSYLATKSIVVHKRKLNQVLSIFTEDNLFRIKNYFYFYRNRIFYVSRYSKIKAVGWWMKSFIDACNLFIHGEIYKSSIILKALIAVFFFSPKIKYPVQK